MPEKTPFRCPEFSCRKKFTSDSWRLYNIKQHHSEHIQVAHKKNLTVRCAPRRIESAQHCALNANKDSVKHVNVFPYPEHFENIADTGPQPSPPPLPWTETYPGDGAPQSDYIAELWEPDTHGCLLTNVQNNPYYPFITHGDYKYIQCGIKKQGMKTYYDNMLMEENTSLRFPGCKKRDGIQQLAPTMPDDQSCGKWELHTFEDMRWNDNHQRPIKYSSRDIISSMRRLMQQPAYAEHHIYTPQRVFNSNTPQKPLYTAMRAADQ
jgi:hypothetical protein